MRIGIIGLGRIGTIHAENVKRMEDVELYAIADIKEDRVKEAKRKFDVKMAYTDPYELISDPKVEAVVICSNTDTHTPLVLASAKMKKHIFCEKPLSLKLEDIDEMLRAVAEANVILFVGFNRRFDKNFKKVREFVQKGSLGTIYMLRIISRDPFPPSFDYIKSSGGIFLDMTIHDFDMARYIMNEEVEEVFATGSVLIDENIGKLGDLDTVVVVLKFRGGSLGVIENVRRAVYGYDQRIEVLGSKGRILVENAKEDLVIFTDESGDHTARYQHFFLDRYKEAYFEELKTFVKNVRNNEPPEVSGEDGKMALLLGYAAKKSFEEKRIVRVEEVKR